MPESEEEIVVCHACGAPMNIASVAPYSRVVCPECRVENRVKKHFGPYVLTRRHAIGGMSSVFVAKDETLDREVALKILSEEYSKDEKRIAAFEQEARLTASFSHPHVVRVYTTGRAFGFFYIAMEFVPGGHFEHKIREKGKIPETEVLPLAIQIAEGLKGAQSAGLIHRDIKPGNILLDSEGNAKIVDFGLALVTKGGKAKATEIWATPYYVPPEAIEGGVEDFRADIYAFGATLYHALAGTPPCSEESMSTTLLKAAKMKVVPLKKAAPELTEETCRAIDRAMAYEPRKRFQSYDEMIPALKNALKAAQGELLRDPNEPTKAQRRAELRARKRRGIFAVAGIAALCVAAVVAVVVSNSGGDEPSEKPPSTVVATGDDDADSPENSQEISNRYLAARRAMAKGDFEKAERIFSKLLADGNVQEPTRTWAGLEGVVAAFMDGRTPDAIRNAKAVERHIAGDPPDLSPGFSSAVEPVLGKLDELPFYKPAVLNSDGEGNERFMAFLIAGLKNWEQGGLEEAAPFFLKLATDPATEGDPVLSWYREAAGRYLSDYELLTSGPLEARPRTPGECEKVIEELNEMLTLLNTRGRAKFNIRARQLDLARIEKTLKAPSVSGGRTDSFWENVDALAKNYRFPEIAALVAKAGSGLADDEKLALIRTNNAALSFLSEMKDDLGNGAVRISLVLRDGTEIDSVTVNGEGDLLGRLASGEIRNMEWKDFAPEQLMALHRQLVENSATDTDPLHRHELAIAFDWLAGARARARAAAEKLSTENEDFKSRWEAISTGLPE